MLSRSIVTDTIGKTFADKLDTVVLEVGPKLTYTRREMVEILGCANFVAAARLQKALKKLKIDSPASLHHMDPFSIARIRGIGEASMFVAMCILATAGYDVQKWWGWKDTNSLKFNSFKHNAMKRARKAQHEI